jgi:adenosylcobinamide-GDP ribazoletransferase
MRLVNAARYLTIFPLPGVPSTPEGPGEAAAWFPIVGLGIGMLVAAVDRAANTLFAPLLAALVTVTFWKLVTGGLHLDGLADCLDGLAGRTPAQRLAIMHDSRVGTFGAAGLVLFLLLEIGAVSGIDPRARAGALVVAPVVGRSLAPLVGRIFPPASPTGHAASFRAGLRAWTPVVTAGSAAVIAVLTMAWWGALALGLAGVVGLTFAAFMARRLSGINGDVHGAVIELGEVVVLLTAAGAAPAR